MTIRSEKHFCNSRQKRVKARAKEVTGLLHVSDRLLAGESSRVEAARGTLNTGTTIKAMAKDTTGLLHVSDRLLSRRIVACGSGQRSTLTIAR